MKNGKSITIKKLIIFWTNIMVVLIKGFSILQSIDEEILMEWNVVLELILHFSAILEVFKNF
jgi:hypothetical protein